MTVESSEAQGNETPGLRDRVPATSEQQEPTSSYEDSDLRIYTTQQTDIKEFKHVSAGSTHFCDDQHLENAEDDETRGNYDDYRESSEPSEQPDGLDFVDAVDIDDGSGVDSELHVYDSRYDTRGEEILLRVGIKQEFENPKERSHNAALVLTRFYSTSKVLQPWRTSLEVRSPYLIKALREVVKVYPGVSFSATSKVVLTPDSSRCLFHHHAELEKYASSSNDKTLQSHMTLCLQYVNRSFRNEISRYNATVGDKSPNPGIDFKNLWMAYKPGELLYQKVRGIENLVTLQSMEIMCAGEDYEHWWLVTKTIETDGSMVGYVYKGTAVFKYEGFAPFTTLSIFPLRFHREEEAIKRRMLKRGTKYISLIGIHHCQYDGKARLSRRGAPTTIDYHLTTAAVRQRIIVDFEECYQNLEGRALDFSEDEEDIIGPASPDLKVDDAVLLICSHEVPAFTLINKQWGWFNVEDIQPVTFNDEGFENLVLPSNKKQLISSIIMSRNLEGFSTDDFVEEVMADRARRPLITSNSGQFIGPPAAVELSLARLLHCATRWQALVLLDEADVFMQARNLQDLERNGIVSMLLRTLEYFEGTLFLTTNRVGTIDSAFMSRIHLALSYEPLSEAARRQLWDTWITRACRGQRPIWVREEFLTQLSRLDVSGRDIKNISLLAQGLAKTGQREMTSEDIWKGADAMTQFQEDFRASVTHQETGKRSDLKVPDTKAMPSKTWLKTLRQWWRS
ncbi:hypothetical protein BDP81DRAFT_454903 [Colletotrichum phormii]|uniref:ATPase AAA-type core domain-containing protein n=1 Tax=Colletotrichum phormii TaxID=359342 RepID=A0AAI9ZE57_9PEZI|nr:uncharacterized protein BDP81DRAFT_454903 [Colletotrichum phormii]KAK1622880.1 hypothetical protein BDP81DRAFT_454903 [Colletotrichum phormii]